MIAADDSDADDLGVGSLPVRERAPELGRLVVVGEGIGRAELERDGPLELDWIDRDDPRGTRMLCSLDRADADSADPRHDHDVPGADARGVHRRPPPGGDRAAKQRGDVERNVAWDLDRAPLGHHGVFGKRREQSRLGDVLAAEVHAERSIQLIALEHQRAVVAQRLHSAGTPAAPTASGDERSHDVVADAQAPDSRPDGLDDPGGLVATAERKMPDGDVAGGEVIIGVTQPRGDNPDQDLVVARWIELDGLHLPFPGNLFQ